MNYVQTKTAEPANWQKSLFFVLWLHLILLGGLYYLNAEDPSSIFPDFILNWFGSGEHDLTATQ